MKNIKKYKEFNETISVAFQTNHSNFLGPGYRWNIEKETNQSPERELLNFKNKFNIDHVQLKKDSNGVYFLVDLEANVPNIWKGIRIFKEKL
jgi:hypothetical protein